MKVHFSNCAHGVSLDVICTQCEQETPFGCGRMIDVQSVANADGWQFHQSMDESPVIPGGRVITCVLTDGISTKDGLS